MRGAVRKLGSEFLRRRLDGLILEMEFDVDRSAGRRRAQGGGRGRKFRCWYLVLVLINTLPPFKSPFSSSSSSVEQA